MVWLPIVFYLSWHCYTTLAKGTTKIVLTSGNTHTQAPACAHSYVQCMLAYWAHKHERLLHAFIFIYTIHVLFWVRTQPYNTTCLFSSFSFPAGVCVCLVSMSLSLCVCSQTSLSRSISTLSRCSFCWAGSCGRSSSTASIALSFTWNHQPITTTSSRYTSSCTDNTTRYTPPLRLRDWAGVIIIKLV